jgi:hypothetical protein
MSIFQIIQLVLFIVKNIPEFGNFLKTIADMLKGQPALAGA